MAKIGQGLTRAGDCIVKIGTGLTSQRGYLARGLMRTRIKVFTCSCHANPCTVPYRRGWRQARSFLSPLRPKPSLRRLQPLAARCKGVWGSREWAVLDSLFAIVFFNRPSLVEIYQKYLIGFMGHCGPRPFNVENRNALHPNLSLCSWSFIRSVS